ncbi:DUF916 and DUF3324 domain-containing protein [Candidatus Enterococcus lemimoniae]|uniref:DUF3324 domain-containing protein n=1 Tax=Candidatus Enterococcus lemimoniae TaxID=1834167 RepID=A0ABZ2T715_9ENTE|nr:DUF916 and DUF3324 domain-containing protein [Enterococcus sp. 12C11_DIV0727]OTO68116.1 hypothetical protein A5866_000311 [Enterococcus sp. 12C11_DIV0727]
MKKYSTCLLLMICLAFFFDPVTSWAKQDSTNLIDGLSYEVLYPENQKNKKLGYFDLAMQPGQEQKVSLKLYNSLSKELTVNVSLNTAKTNSIGKVEYGPNDLKADSSLTTDFIKIVKGPSKVVIPARSSKQLELMISLPKEMTPGLIAGGIQLQPVADSTMKDQGKKDIVVNEFAFLVGMLLRVGDTSSIKPELKLNKTYIAFKDGKSHLFVNISNSRPAYVEGMEVEVQVRKTNKQKVLFEYQKKDMRMAPNSVIDLPIDLADKGVSAGDYSAQISIISKTGDRWSWTEDFKVNVLEANSFNQQSVEHKSDSKPMLWMIVVIVGVCGLVFLSRYKLIKHKKHKRTETEKARK